jgi:hypothetical protein
MAPGCSNINLKSAYADTIDSFEVLEQTVMKQKRMNKKKKTDLRMRTLLKRTFDLVCEIMDRENGFDSDLNEVDLKKTTTTVHDDRMSIESIPLPVDKPSTMTSECEQLDEKKEYHTLTNVVPMDGQTCGMENFVSNENRKAKRKSNYDDYSDADLHSRSNKKLKTININSIVYINNIGQKNEF